MSHGEQTIKRYDLVQVNACYTTDHEMQLSDDGEWVRYEDVAFGEGETAAAREALWEAIVAFANHDQRWKLRPEVERKIDALLAGNQGATSGIASTAASPALKTNDITELEARAARAEARERAAFDAGWKAGVYWYPGDTNKKPSEQRDDAYTAYLQQIGSGTESQ